MSRSFFLSIAAASLACFMVVEAAPSTAPSSSEVRALSREVELHQQAVQTVKMDQELLDERLRALENQINQMQKELSQITRALTKGDVGKSSESSASTQMLATWNQWRLQTDQNISHLQQSLQALVKAMHGASDPTSASASGEIHVVQSGDTLEKIAKKHQTTVSVLMELNQLKSSKIWKGQKLKLPTP